MASKVISIEKFRLSLLRETVKLSEIKDELLITTGTVVPTDISSTVSRIHNRWRKVNNSIREPDITTVSSLSNYISYLVQEIDRWKVRELAKFNRALNYLYSEVATEGGGIDDLIQIGYTSASPRVSGASKQVESTLREWARIFPNLYGDVNTKDTDMEYMFDSLTKRIRSGLIACNPESVLFDIASRSFGGESTQASWIKIDQPPALGPMYMHGPINGTLDSKVYSARGLTRHIVFTNFGTASVNQTKQFELCTVPDGGITITYDIRQLNIPSIARQVLNINGDGTVLKVMSPESKLLSDLTRVTFIVRGSTGDNIVGVSAVSDKRGASITIPFDPGFQTRIIVEVNAVDLPINSISGIVLVANTFMLSGATASKLMTNASTIIGLPKIIDTIGNVPSSFAYFIHSPDVEILWRFARVYNTYQVSLAQPSLVAMITKIFRRVLGSTTITVDERVLDLGWWLANTSEFNLSEKRNAYRQLYSMLDDHLVAALSDVSLRKFYLA